MPDSFYTGDQMSSQFAHPAVSPLVPGEHEAVLNGVRLHYTIRGSGPALLAHSGGPGMDARGWDDFAHIDDFATVVALHPRGSGLSQAAPDNTYALGDYAADLEALRRHLGLERPVVMGWSHGGMVAQQYAFSYPDSLSKLILVDTAAYFGEFLGDVAGAVKGFKDQPWYAESFAALQREWAGDYQSDEDMARLWALEMKFYFKHFDARAEAYHARTRHLPVRIAPLKFFNEREAPAMDLRPRLKEVRVPTLIIVGRHDFITTVDMAREMAKHLPDARLEIFEESGHFAVVEEPEKFKRVVQGFVVEQ
jgi:proline iminopeptidase